MVLLVIKHPSPQIEDYRVEYDLSKTIGDLKEHLWTNYPAKPHPSQQKLIFAGRLLQNEIVLADLFKQYDTTSPQIIHIVFSRSQPPTAQPVHPDVQPQQVPPFHFQQQGPFNPMIQQQFPNQNPFIGQHVQNGFQGQMWNPQPQFMGPMNPPMQQPPQQPQQQPMYNPQPQQRQNEGDGFYLILKLALMVYIFSQGGTTTKTVILCIVALFIYLYQTGRLRVFVNVQQYPAVEAQRRQQQQANNPPPAQNQEQPANEPQNIQQNIPQTNTDNQRSGFIDEIAALVLPFFYSISPTYQPPISRNEQPRVPVPDQDVIGQRN